MRAVGADERRVETARRQRKVGGVAGGACQLRHGVAVLKGLAHRAAWPSGLGVTLLRLMGIGTVANEGGAIAFVDRLADWRGGVQHRQKELEE